MQMQQSEDPSIHMEGYGTTKQPFLCPPVDCHCLPWMQEARPTPPPRKNLQTLIPHPRPQMDASPQMQPLLVRECRSRVNCSLSDELLLLLPLRAAAE